jgi:mannose/cellobiose epimerase-like protein (N-acyl-D-glucosamine 2-epimerase family)
MKKIILLSIILINSIYSQPVLIKSEYLVKPDKIIGYVDSCATFWLKAYDQTSGGFYTNINKYGNVITSWGTNKNMITQSRDAYGFVRAYMLTGNENYLKMARNALNFMYEHAWDSLYGGWFNDLDKYGKPTKPNDSKTAFFQHYALLGISAYYEATHDTLDWKWLLKGYNNNENKLWDNREQFYGYYDYANRDWSNPQAKSFNATVDAITTHLLYLYLMTGDEAYKSKLIKLAGNIANYMVASMDTQKIGFVEKYDSNWNWNNSEEITIMGHVLKAGWCLGRIYQLQPNKDYIPSAEKLINNVLEKGYDHKYGGPYKDYNRVTGQMLMWGNPDTAKAWWQMEQAVLGGMELYQITGKVKYLLMADETLDFFMKYFVDHVYGEVYENRTRYGKQTWGEHKGNGFKAGYHSIELGYYVYLYAKAFITNEPITLHYNFISETKARDILLNPIELPNDKIKIKKIYHNDRIYTNYDSTNRILHLPANTAGHFKVIYQTDARTIPEFITYNKISPRQYELYQNYPNPFNPSTIISYRLNRKSNVRLVIYNITGQKVRELVNTIKGTGYHKTNWDGKNDFGVNVSSGIYIYELRTEEHREAKKMILIR